jgi:hypothetical protein
VWEGAEAIASTVTGPDGCFEIGCDLYGCPENPGEPDSEWRPERYYALVAEKKPLGMAKCLLVGQDLEDSIRLRIESR